MVNSLPYRKNVCLLIRNKDGKLFLGEREGEPGVWQFPQGGVEDASSLEENVLREASEELGAQIGAFHILRKLTHTHRYDFAKPPAYALGKYRGQDQTFWLVEFIGSDKEIDLENSDREFRNWCWATPDEVRAKAEKKRLPGYEGALSELALLK